MVRGGRPPLFFTKFPKKLRNFQIFTSKLQANYRQIKYNYLIYNKIKFLFFLLKSIVFIKIVVYLQCQTTHKQKQTTMKTQLNPDQGWESLREAAAKIYKENGEKMRVKFCANEYELTTSEWDGVHWYAGSIDEEAAAIFMDTNGKGFKYYHLIIDPLLRAQIVKVTLLDGEFTKKRKQINEKLITIL